VAQPNLPTADLAKERAERAARVGAMLERWAAVVMSGEPDWDVEGFERLNLTRNLADEDRATPTKP
jgi:hypothetical protein